MRNSKTFEEWMRLKVKSIHYSDNDSMLRAFKIVDKKINLKTK